MDIKETTFDGQAPGLDSSMLRTITGGVTLDVSLVPHTRFKRFTVLGQVTATGKARLYGSAPLASDVSSGTTLTLDSALCPFVVGDTLDVEGTDTTITAIDLDTMELTVDTVVSAVTGDLVKNTDGSETPIGLCLVDVSFADGRDKHVGVADWARVSEAACFLVDADAKSNLDIKFV